MEQELKRKKGSGYDIRPFVKVKGKKLRSGRTNLRKEAEPKKRKYTQITLWNRIVRNKKDVPLNEGAPKGAHLMVDSRNSDYTEIRKQRLLNLCTKRKRQREIVVVRGANRTNEIEIGKPVMADYRK